MSVVKTVGKGVAWTSGAILVGKILTIANIFIILRNLTVYEYGFNELVLSIISTVGILLLPGLVTTIIADLSVERGRENLAAMKQIFTQYFFLNLALGFLAWAVLFFGSAPIAAWAGNPYAAQFLHIASFLFLISPMRTITITLSTVMLRYFEQSFYNVFEEAFKMILMFVLLVQMHTGIHGLMYSIVLSQLLVVLMYLPRTISAYRHFADAESESGIFFWNLVREHRKWSIASSYIGTLTQNARLWGIKALLGTEAVGLFAFAYGVMNNITSLVPLSSVIAPVIPHYIDKRDQLVRMVRASVKIQIAVTVGFLVLALIISNAVVRMFFPNYIDAIPLVYIMLFSIVPNGIVSVYTPVFNAFKEQRSLFMSNVFKAVLMCVSLPVSVYFFGSLGTAIELNLTTYINSIERHIRLQKLLPTYSLSWSVLFKSDAYEREAASTVFRGLLGKLGGFTRAKKNS